MPTATPPAPADKPEEQPQQSAADRLLRAQATELEALRAQMQNLPDVDTVANWRAKAEKFDSLSAELPQWREQLQSAHQQEREQLAEQLQQSEADLSRQRLRSEIQAAFLQAGGNLMQFENWMELYGSKFVKSGDNGLFSIENGQNVPLADLLNQHRTDQLYGVLFHPRYGSGSGARGGRDVRVSNSQDLSKTPTSKLFHQAFGSRRS